MTALWNARNEWYNIGLALEIPPDELDEVKKTCQDKPNECFTELLKRWLKRGTPQPTWSAIVKALRAKIVCQGHLASEVENSYILFRNSIKDSKNKDEINMMLMLFFPVWVFYYLIKVFRDKNKKTLCIKLYIIGTVLIIVGFIIAIFFI